MKLLLLIIASISCYANSFDFKIKPIKLTENSYYIYGKEEYFSKENGGDIANSAFIITKNSVILIDTGSSVEYGQQLKKAIKKITNKPIKYIINTHHHPDHFLGNYAFKDVKIYATKHTKDDIKNNGELYISNMVNLIGKIAYTTKIKIPNTLLEKKELVLDGYKLKVLYLNGHTKSDIVIYDEKTKILYTSDLVFNNRALATPHANLQDWIKALEKLKTIDFKVLVAGHGKASYNKKVLDENIFYLQYLDTTLKNAVKQGFDTFEILEQEHPKEVQNYSMFKEEFERSIINLYPKYENQ
ncbi:quinoprotein relay system zinc metallohydrolase 1 [Arcobacter sp. YIC-310]|uniref:quinoprotein relay system zinc metallohydrolase 1 n=1 Tax=Arcobacter sp. YIC-310 TaxID=3376632 RepID=UPI003C17A015